MSNEEKKCDCATCKLTEATSEEFVVKLGVHIRTALSNQLSKMVEDCEDMVDDETDDKETHDAAMSWAAHRVAEALLLEAARTLFTVGCPNFTKEAVEAYEAVRDEEARRMVGGLLQRIIRPVEEKVVGDAAKAHSPNN